MVYTGDKGMGWLMWKAQRAQHVTIVFSVCCATVSAKQAGWRLEGAQCPDGGGQRRGRRLVFSSLTESGCAQELRSAMWSLWPCQ